MDNCKSAFLNCGPWNLIAFTLSTLLSQRVYDIDLSVRFDILSCNIFHLWGDEANIEYIRCITPKNSLAFSHELAISQITKFKL